MNTSEDATVVRGIPSHHVHLGWDVKSRVHGCVLVLDGTAVFGGDFARVSSLQLIILFGLSVILFRFTADKTGKKSINIIDELWFWLKEVFNDPITQEG